MRRSRCDLRMKESCRTCEGVMLHIWKGPVALVKESCRTCEGAMSHIWRSHIAHMKEPCRIYEGVMSHTWRSHVAHMKESCRSYEGFMLSVWGSHVFLDRDDAANEWYGKSEETWKYKKRPENTKRDLKIRKETNNRAVMLRVSRWRDSFVCGMTYLYGWYVSSLFVTWLICNKHDSSIY